MSDDFDKKLPWEDDNDDSGSSGGDDLPEFDWEDTGDDAKRRPDDDRLGVTGELSWLQDSGDDDAPRPSDDDLPEIDWGGDDEGAAPGDSDRLGVTGELTWRQQDDEARFEEQLDAAERAAEPAPDDDVPDWMQGLDAGVHDPTVDINYQGDVPDWMREDDWSQGETDDVSGADDDVPDWMRDEPAAASDAGADDDVPDWMRDEPSEVSPPFQDASPGVDGADDDVPDWMRDEPSEVSPPFQDASPGVDDDVPDWMRDEPSEVSPPFQNASPITDDEDDLSDLFGDDELPGEFGAPEIDTGELFGDLDFAVDDEDEFELLRGGDTGDLLGDGDGEFDLLGELADDPADEVFAEMTGTSDLDNLGDLDSLFGADTDDDDEDLDDIDALLGGDMSRDVNQMYGDVLESAEEFDWGDQPATPADVDDLEWMSEIDTGDDFPDEALPDDDAPLPADDDFLADLEPAQPAQSGASGEDYDVDDFLATLDERSLMLPDTGELAPGLDLEFDELFDPTMDGEEEAASAPQQTSAPLSEDAPEWLTDLSSSVGRVSAASMVRQQQDRPVEELPDRLRALRDRGMSLPAESEDAEETPLDLSAGAVLGTAGVPGALILTSEQEKRVQLLQSVVGRGAETLEDAVPARDRRRVRVRIERLLVTLVLLVVVVLPFVLDGMRLGDVPPSQFSAGSASASFYDQVDGLQPGQLVLIAAEYGPTSAAELDDAAETLLLHALLRGARPVIVGGNPVGLLHADNIVRRIAEANDFTRNEDYYVGRYLVADVIGLRAFSANVPGLVSTDVRGDATGLQISGLDDFAAIIVIAERSDRLRSWAEQVAPLTNAPLLGITGFAAAPLSEPYIRANSDVRGLLVGYEDAYTYRMMLSAELGILPPTPTPTPTVEPTDTPEPTETDIPASPTPIDEDDIGAPVMPTLTEEAVDEPEPTDEPEATATNTPRPTNTPSPTRTPTPTATPEPQVFGTVVATSAVNVRGGPSTSDAAVAVLQPGERVRVIGENADATWYNVVLEDGTEGWIAEFLLEIEIVTEPTSHRPEREVRTLARAAGPHHKAQLPDNNQDDDEPESTPEPSPADDGDEAEDAAAPLLVIPGVDPADPDAYRAGYRDERWYSMTVGIIAAAGIIAFGSLVNIVRALGRRRKR